MFAPEGAQSQSCRRIPLALIDQVVSARLGQTRVVGNAQPAVFNRQIAMYLAKHVGGWSTTRIGRFYNGRDHSTVCYALKRVGDLRENDPELGGLVSSLAAEIKTALPNETARTDTQARASAGAHDLRFNDALLDALADRLATRIFDRAKRYSSPKRLNEPGCSREAIADLSRALAAGNLVLPSGARRTATARRVHLIVEDATSTANC